MVALASQPSLRQAGSVFIPFLRCFIVLLSQNHTKHQALVLSTQQEHWVLSLHFPAQLSIN